MKKIWMILALACVMVACNNSAEEKDNTADSLRIADSLRSADSLKMMSEPAQNMSPLDTLGRRPRD